VEIDFRHDQLQAVKPKWTIIEAGVVIDPQAEDRDGTSWSPQTEMAADLEA